MPIYELYCRMCNTIYNFFARSANTDKIPSCPKCKRVKLKRQMSIFARVSRSRGGEDIEEGMPPIDEARMEKAMSLLAGEAERINEDDPRQAANLMRKLSEATGLNMGPGMEEALQRLERGEDPEQIEAEMGDLLGSEEPFTFEQKRKKDIRKKPGPRVDETIYDL